MRKRRPQKRENALQNKPTEHTRAETERRRQGGSQNEMKQRGITRTPTRAETERREQGRGQNKMKQRGITRTPKRQQRRTLRVVAAFTEESGGFELSESGRRVRTVPVTSHQHSTTQHTRAQHSRAQYSTAQHSRAQHITSQHSRPEHSTSFCAERQTATPRRCKRARGTRVHHKRTDGRRCLPTEKGSARADCESWVRRRSATRT